MNTLTAIKTGKTKDIQITNTSNMANKFGKWLNDITGKTAQMEAEQTYNAEQAELNRQWQEQMSNTAIQRQAKDMKAAGINTAMAFGSGSASGASTPSGSAASQGGATSSAGVLGSALGSMVTLAIGLGKIGMKWQADKAATAAREAFSSRVGFR